MSKNYSAVKPGVSELFNEKGNLPLPGFLLSSRKFVLKLNFEDTWKVSITGSINS